MPQLDIITLNIVIFTIVIFFFIIILFFIRFNNPLRKIGQLNALFSNNGVSVKESFSKHVVQSFVFSQIQKQLNYFKIKI